MEGLSLANMIQLTVSGSNTDGSFTTSISILFFSSLEKNHKAADWE